MRCVETWEERVYYIPTQPHGQGQITREDAIEVALAYVKTTVWPAQDPMAILLGIERVEGLRIHDLGTAAKWRVTVCVRSYVDVPIINDSKAK